MVMVVVVVVAADGKAKLSGRREKGKRVETVVGEKKRVETRRRARCDGWNLLLLCYYCVTVASCPDLLVFSTVDLACLKLGIHRSCPNLSFGSLRTQPVGPGTPAYRPSANRSRARLPIDAVEIVMMFIMIGFLRRTYTSSYSCAVPQ